MSRLRNLDRSVVRAINQFRAQEVDLDPDQVRRARTSRDFLFEQLETLARTNDNRFPVMQGSAFHFGSFARGTKIRPLDDIDAMVPLKSFNWRSSLAPHSTYSYIVRVTDSRSPLLIYADDEGYVNSTRVLYGVRDALGTVAQYRRADIHKRQHAVTLKLRSYDWNFDVVPAIPVYSWGQLSYYFIPDGAGAWIRTNPHIDQKNIRQLDTHHLRNLRPAIRLIKYWNERTFKPVLPSFYLETLVLKTLSWSPFNSLPSSEVGVGRFFRDCPRHLLAPCADPKELGQRLDAGVSADEKRSVADAMVRMYQHYELAVKARRGGDYETVLDAWQAIFGPAFANYR